MTTDLLVVPVDRLRPIEGSDVPRRAHSRRTSTSRLRSSAATAPATYELRGDAMARRDKVARRARLVKLTGKEQLVDGRRYFETTDGRWLCETHAARIDRVEGAYEVGARRRALDRREHRQPDARRLRRHETGVCDAGVDGRGRARRPGDDEVDRHSASSGSSRST